MPPLSAEGACQLVCCCQHAGLDIEREREGAWHARPLTHYALPLCPLSPNPSLRMPPILIPSLSRGDVCRHTCIHICLQHACSHTCARVNGCACVCVCVRARASLSLVRALSLCLSFSLSLCLSVICLCPCACVSESVCAQTLNYET